MVKYIVTGIIALLVIVVVSVAVTLALYNQQPEVSAGKSTYMYTLSNNEKEKFIVTNLADGRLVRMQLTLELDGNYAPKDMKNPGRKLVAMQDVILQTIRHCRSIDMEPQNQHNFKKTVTDSAAKIVGTESVQGVYITSIAFQ